MDSTPTGHEFFSLKSNLSQSCLKMDSTPTNIMYIMKPGDAGRNPALKWIALRRRTEERVKPEKRVAILP